MYKVLKGNVLTLKFYNYRPSTGNNVMIAIKTAATSERPLKICEIMLIGPPSGLPRRAANGGLKHRMNIWKTLRFSRHV